MNTTQPLAVIEPQQQVTPSTGQLLAAVVQGGITGQNVDVLERIVALKEREDKREAERLFADAFADLQAEMPKIEAKKIVPGSRQDEVRYRYAPYEEIMRQVQPFLARHGFAVTFDTEIKEPRVEVTCTLIHRSGHSRSNKQGARIGKGPPGSSEAQGDGAATTYAKRFALCAALNIVVEQDSDGRDADSGDTITKEQAADLRLRCEETSTDMAKFCRWLGASGFESIRASDWERADAKLKEREAKARA